MTLGDLLVRVGADIGEFQSSMGVVSKQLDAIDRDAQKSVSGFQKLGSSLSSVGKGLTAAVTLPIVAAGAAVVKFAADFDAEMRKVSSLITGGTQKDFNDLSAATLKLSRELGIDAVGAANALYEALSAGVPKENAIDFIRVASKAAIAGTTDTKVAVNSLTTVLAAYNLSLNEAKNVSDAMFTAVKIGKFQFADLAAVIGPAASGAKALGISYQELLASTATLSITAGSAGVAVTQIESAMRSLQDPSKQMQAALKQIGFDTASAAVKTLGFEGTLEALRKATGGSAEAFQALFGRIEGYHGALGLTGDRAKVAAGDLDTMRHATDGLGASQEAENEINKGAKRQFEMLTVQIKDTAIELGTALLPALNSLMQSSKPLVDGIKSAVDWFKQLPPGLQATTIATVALAAGIGPVLWGVGQMVTVLSGLSKALFVVTDVAKLTAEFKALLPILSSVAAVAAGAALAFVGFDLFQKISNETATLKQNITNLLGAYDLWKEKAQDQVVIIQQCDDSIQRYNAVLTYLKSVYEELSKINWWDKIVESLGPVGALYGALNSLNKSLSTLSAYLGIYPEMDAAVKKAADQQGKAVAAFMRVSEAALGQASALRGLKGGMKDVDVATAGVTDGQRKLTKEQAEAGKAAEALQKHWEDMGKAATQAELRYKSVLATYQNGKATLEQLARAQQNLQAADDAAHPEKKAERYAKADKEMQDRYDDMAKSIIDAGQKLQDLDRDLERSKIALQKTYNSAHAEMAKSSKAASEAIKSDWMQGVGIAGMSLPGRQSTIAMYGDLYKQYEEDMKRLKVARSAEADEAIALYERQKAAGIASATEIYKAEKAMLEAIIQDRRTRGEEIPKEEQARLDQLEVILGGHLKKQAGKWGEYTRQVSTILSDLAKSVTKRMFSLFQDDPENEKLKKEEESLRASLAERAKTWEEYQADVAAKMEKLHADYAADLAEQENALRADLEERRKDYEEYVADVGVRLEELRAKHAAEAEQERSDLLEKLDEKRQAYEEYAADVADRITEIRTASAEDLAADLERLREQLAEKREAYEDYVSDVNKSLKRIREDLAEDVDDKKRDINRGIEDKKRAFQREERDLTEKIAKEQAKGSKANKEQISDWQRTLNEKRSDLQLYVTRAAEDLAEFTDDHKREAKQQEDDLKESLARRTREYDQFVATNATAQATTVTEHKRQLDKQLADLAEGLTKRRTEYESYAAKVAIDLEAISVKHATQLASEEKDLQTSLDKKTASYQAYREQAISKFEGIRADAATKLTQQEIDLRTSLDKQSGEWETYKTNVLNRLSEIETEYKNTWERIGGSIKGVLTDVGQSISRFVIEYIEGKLVKSLLDLITGEGSVIAKLGSKLAGVFGWFSGGGDALPGAVNTAANVASDTALSQIRAVTGTASQGAGSAVGGMLSSGIMGTLAGIGGAVSAVSGVISNFQMAGMNKSLDLIVRHTLQTVMIGEATFYLIENRLTSIHSRLVEFLRDHAWRVHDIWEVNTKIFDSAAIIRDAVVQIRDAMISPATGEAVGTGGGQALQLVLQIDGRNFAEATIDDIGDLLTRRIPGLRLI